ncbi:MAG TPA: tetratricopeptide repeat protein [Cyclobacteriaceae bacterium]|nr:tetratricopeptide repeat protein [Cyclobacteriaceae bacterium]
MLKKCLIPFFLVFLGLSSFSQTTDSLLSVLDTVRNDRKVKTLNELFRAYLQSDPIKALAYTREALNLAIEIADKKGIAASYNNLGVAYRNQGALDKALEYYTMSLKLYEDLDNKEGVATLKNNIANIFAMKKEFGQAIKYLEESYQIFVALNDKEKIVGSMNNLGNLNLDLQLYEKALKNYSEAYQLSVQNGIKFPDPVNNIGNIYFQQGNYQRAIENYQRALQIEKENNNRLGILNTLTNIGIAYAKAGQPGPARKFLDEAKALCNELQAYSYLPPILKYNAEILYREGKSKDAYEAMVSYDSMREKIYGEESTRKIAQMEMALDFQEKEKEIQMLQKESEITSLQLRNSRLFIVLIIVGLLTIMGAVNWYFMGKRKKIFGSTQS